MYEYMKLETGQIRIVHIQSNLQNGLLQCTLQSIVLAAAADSYIALSWTWGDDATTQSRKPIMMNGQLLNVRPNLWAMLHSLRLRNEIGPFWVDAICINQDSNDPQEKNEQIPMMAEIYRMAKEVYVWLGPSADDSDYVIDTINRGEEEAYTTSKFVTGLVALLGRPYWRRTWIVQEFVLNEQSPKLLCGQASKVSAQLLLSVFQLPHVLDSTARNHLSGNAIAYYKLYHIRNNRGNGDVSWLEPDLRNVLYWLKGFEAHEPRDKVYAALGLIKGANRAHFIRELGVDVGRPVTEVFRDAVMFLLKYEKSCTIFYDFPPGRHNGLKGPSWVPNLFLERSKELETPIRLGDIQSDGHNKALEDVIISEDRSTLIVRGRVLDSISDRLVISNPTTPDKLTLHPNGEILRMVSRLHVIQKRVQQIRALAGSEQVCSEPLWKTLIAGTYGSSTNPDLKDEVALQQHFDELMAIPLSHAHFVTNVGLNYNSSPKILGKIMLTLSAGRCFFVGQAGYYGISEPGAQERDVIALLFPDRFIPFILRACDEGYEMVGVAYIPQPMLDRAIADMESDRRRLKSFAIV